MLKWTGEEIEWMDRKSRKLMTKYKMLHPKRDVARLYVPRNKGEMGLISCEGCTKGEEKTLGWYVTQSNEPMLKVKIMEATIKSKETVRPEEFKRMQINTREQAWKEKRMHGQREMDENIYKDKTWGWLKNDDLKACIEVLICAAQDQALRTNYVKQYIDYTMESPLCRLCGDK